MPQAAKRPCSRPFCPRLLDRGEECPDHGQTARKRENDRDPHRRSKRRFYQSPEWRAFREDILVRDPVCRIKLKCGPKGSPSTCVDHTIPIEEGGEPLDPENAVGACWPCHSAKTAKKDGGFGNPKVRGGRVKSSKANGVRTARSSNARAGEIQEGGGTPTAHGW